MSHAFRALVAVAMRVVMALVDSETMVRADAAALSIVVRTALAWPIGLTVVAMVSSMDLDTVLMVES